MTFTIHEVLQGFEVIIEALCPKLQGHPEGLEFFNTSKFRALFFPGFSKVLEPEIEIVLSENGGKGRDREKHNTLKYLAKW